MPVAAEKFGAHRLSGDYTAVASGLGAHAERITRAADIAPAIARAAAITMAGRPAVLEFITRADPEVPRYFTPTY
jgi:thiamine pyrophosphate-dependent acetolactate synthase large subunit-like protein